MAGKVLVLDASVAIDYARCGRFVLGLAAQHFGGVILLLPVLVGEVRALDPLACEQLGIRVELPSTEQLLAAAHAAETEPRRLSWRDHLCRIYARDGGHTCVTADKNLRKACIADSTAVMWGLTLMLELVEARQLPVTAAIQVAQEIGRSNDRLRDETVAEFCVRVRELGDG